jgi:hypothetical protein
MEGASSMKRAVIVAAALLLSACGPIGREKDRIEKIQACIDRGGDPEYTTTRNGRVRRYLGCQEATR